MQSLFEETASIAHADVHISFAIVNISQSNISSLKLAEHTSATFEHSSMIDNATLTMDQLCTRSTSWTHQTLSVGSQPLCTEPRQRDPQEPSHTGMDVILQLDGTPLPWNASVYAVSLRNVQTGSHSFNIATTQNDSTSQDTFEQTEPMAACEATPADQAVQCASEWNSVAYGVLVAGCLIGATLALYSGQRYHIYRRDWKVLLCVSLGHLCAPVCHCAAMCCYVLLCVTPLLTGG